uniref:Uncharacterized protein n=1 Tax=viral metagenome TaxID=1070528 RepID=A0A6C0KSK8_9ZZZZ
MSLLANIDVSKTSVGSAERMIGNRTLNPDYQLCPIWNGNDLAGRSVCLDSFYTKYAGCNSALDRIKVENFLRPAYMNYVTQSAAGIAAVDADYGSNLAATASGTLSSQRQSAMTRTGGYGNVDPSQYISGNTSKMDTMAANAYQNTQDQASLAAQQRRNAQSLGIGNSSQTRMNRSGSANINTNVMSKYDRNADYMYNNSVKNQDMSYLAINQYKMPVTPKSLLLA